MLGSRRVDVLINKAGEFAGGLLDQGPARADAGGRTGKIVNNASIAGYVPFPGAAVPSATKAGVVGFTEALRRELGESEVTVLEVVSS